MARIEKVRLSIDVRQCTTREDQTDGPQSAPGFCIGVVENQAEHGDGGGNGGAQEAQWGGESRGPIQPGGAEERHIERAGLDGGEARVGGAAHPREDDEGDGAQGVGPVLRGGLEALMQISQNLFAAGGRDQRGDDGLGGF